MKGKLNQVLMHLRQFRLREICSGFSVEAANPIEAAIELDTLGITVSQVLDEFNDEEIGLLYAAFFRAAPFEDDREAASDALLVELEARSPTTEDGDE